MYRLVYRTKKHFLFLCIKPIFRTKISNTYLIWFECFFTTAHLLSCTCVQGSRYLGDSSIWPSFAAAILRCMLYVLDLMYPVGACWAHTVVYNTKPHPSMKREVERLPQNSGLPYDSVSLHFSILPHDSVHSVLALHTAPGLCHPIRIKYRPARPADPRVAVFWPGRAKTQWLVLTESSPALHL